MEFTSPARKSWEPTVTDPPDPNYKGADNEIEDMFNSYSDYDEINDMINSNVVAGWGTDTSPSGPLMTTDGYTPAEIAEYLEVYFRFFSKSDLDLIYLHFIGGKAQVELQDLFHKTQPAISCTVERIRAQIPFIIRQQNRFNEFIEFISDPELRICVRDKNILLLFFYTTSIAKTAQVIGIKKMQCRARIVDAIKGLQQAGYDRMGDLFEDILTHLNKVRKSVSKGAVAPISGRKDFTSGHVTVDLPLEWNRVEE